MAQEFPHAQVIGIDLAPTTTRPPPSNCRFEFDDFTLGLEHYYGQFDLVHARSTANGVKDFEWLVQESALCLRPGGVLILIEGNFEILNEFGEVQERAYGEGGPGQSWFARICFEAYNTMKARGSHVDAGIMLERWMRNCRDLDQVGYRTLNIPLGPWEQGATEEETRQKEFMGTLMRQNMKEFARALKPTFLSNGYPPDLVDRFISGVDQELSELQLHMHLRYHHSWARRVQQPGLADGSKPESTTPAESNVEAEVDMVDIEDVQDIESEYYDAVSETMSEGAVPN